MKNTLLSVLVAMGLAACGGGGEEAASSEPAPSTEPAPPPVDSATAATISGKVTLDGEAPAQDEIQMAADPVCAKLHSEPVTTVFVVTGDEGTLQNVFVWVKEGIGGSHSAPSDPVTLDQLGCIYSPHVFGVMAGQDIEIVNSDDTLHNIHAMPENNPQFNIGQPVKGLKTTRKFDIEEVMVPFKCDVHKWMNSYVGVVSHPYFGVTGSDGGFSIGNLPPGDYVIEAWHESFGTQTQSVTVGASETAEVNFSFTAGD